AVAAVARGPPAAPALAPLAVARVPRPAAAAARPCAVVAAPAVPVLPPVEHSGMHVVSPLARAIAPGGFRGARAPCLAHTDELTMAREAVNPLRARAAVGRPSTSGVNV